MYLVQILTNYITGTKIERIIDRVEFNYPETDFWLDTESEGLLLFSKNDSEIIPCINNDRFFIINGEYHPGMILNYMCRTC